DVLIGIRDRLSDLVVNPSGGEVGEGSCKRDLPAYGHSRSDPYHVSFGNPYLEESLRMIFLEVPHLQGTGKVGTKSYHVFIPLSQFCKTVPKTGAGVFFPGICIFFHCFLFIAASINNPLRSQ